VPTQFKLTTAAPYIGNESKQFIAAGTDYPMISDLVGHQLRKGELWLWA
jgi:hypothetical protein